jgi:hypothetical protein
MATLRANLSSTMVTEFVDKYSMTLILHFFSLSYCAVSVPLTPLSTLMGRWIFGAALCKILPQSQVIISCQQLSQAVLQPTSQGVNNCPTALFRLVNSGRPASVPDSRELCRAILKPEY